MASAALKDVEDKYFECSVCLENFKEPKLLTCLHRICKGCLEKIIEKHKDGEFKCPLCNELCDIPPEGVDGFRTDFHMKSMLEYILLQQTAKTEDLTAKCTGCLKESKITSYCFKCKGFLCEQCSTIFLTMNLMKEHKGSNLSLKEIREQKLSMEKLASLTETPRCKSHVDKPAEVCCGTCQNLPVCMVCAHFGQHKAHDIQDVDVVAEKERSRIGETIVTLEQCSDNVNQLPARVDKVKEKLSECISAAKKKLESQLTELSENIERRLKNNDEMLKRNKKEIDDLEKQEVAELEEERKKEIEAAVKRINDKFDKLVGERRAKNQGLRNGLETFHGERGGRINKGTVLVERAYKDIDCFVDQQGNTHEEKLEKISNEATNMKMRYDNFRSTTSSILASKDNWTEAQCLPDIGKASDSLIRELKKDFLELEPLEKVEAGDLITTVGGIVRINGEPESVVDIGGGKANVIHMKYTDSGSIVITGNVDNEHSHITVIDREGKLISENKINQRKRDNGIFVPTCSPLSLFKVVTTCIDGNIGIHNTPTGSHIRKHMRDIVSDWGDKLVSSVTTDQINKNVYIGTGSRDVFVLDEKLNYRHTLQLPQGVRQSTDMVIHYDNLIVCDIWGKKVYIVTREGPEAKLVCELPKPDHIDGDWGPYRLCTDCSGSIYIIWQSKISAQWRSILTQHSPDGHRLLITKDVAGVVSGIDTMLTGGTEKLVLVTRKGKLYTYGLLMET